MSGAWKILWVIAFRNVWRNRTKSLIVGFLLFLCTGLVVFGNALVDAVGAGMERSVTQSVSGHLQVYSADAKDKIALFGDEFAGMPDIGVIPDFGALATIIRKVPNVRSVVPMGIDFALGSSGNELDRWLARLRQAVRDNDKRLIAQRKEEVRAVCERLDVELQGARELTADTTQFAQDLQNAKRAASAEFWAEFDRDPLAALEWLENKVAPLETQMSDMGLMFLGTDLAAFEANFDRFEIVRGQRVPNGERGFLFNDGFYEEVAKHRVARGLDKLMKMRREGDTIADSADMRSLRDRLANEYRRVLYQLDKAAGEAITRDLRALLEAPDADLAALLQLFLRVDDDTLEARHAWFYAHIAPHLQLYTTQIGDTFPLQAFTKAGYSKSVNVKVYGTYKFKGLEDSDIGKTFNLVDLVTFRDLYSLMTPERRAEIQALREKAGVKDVQRADAEAVLFGGGADSGGVERVAQAGTIDEFAGEALAKVGRREAITTFDPAELEKGVALNAAVLLKDPTRIEETRADIEAALTEAGVKMNIVDWQAASGMIGQLVVVARVVLFVLVFLLMLVAMVVINNSMVIATLERVKEIGTMRAIGAGRGWIGWLFLAETTMLGLVSGGVGLLGAAGGVAFWGYVGLPATNAFMQFLFGGPRLYPSINAAHLGEALLLILAFALVSTLYPARLAARISPREAMASDG
jgi:ABC-type lipoprotein release transport system permease subunit